MSESEYPSDAPLAPPRQETFPERHERDRGASSTPSWARQAFVLGPDAAPGDEPIGGRLATLLSWPVRLILVLGVLAVGFIFNDAPLGRQLGWGLEYGALIALSLVATPPADAARGRA